MNKLIYKINQLNKSVSYDEIRKEIFGTELAKEMYKNKYHFGQLKLFMSELLFLSKYAKHENILVLYVGAANGYHTWYMAKHMFPNFKFHLFDRTKFHDIFYEQKLDNVKIISDYFSEKYANKYSQNTDNILFMCDMRNLDIKLFKDKTLKNKDEYIKKPLSEDQEQIISKDMNDQLAWAEIMKPLACYLKFRLPYDGTNFDYLKGKIYLQPYSPNGNECRILITQYEKKIEYNSSDIDGKIAYFNWVMRVQEIHTKWDDICDKYKIKNKWDNVYSLYIVQYYLKKFGRLYTKKNTANLFLDIVKFHQEANDEKYSKIFI